VAVGGTPGVILTTGGAETVGNGVGSAPQATRINVSVREYAVKRRSIGETFLNGE
jgi:hypothetical protein